MSGRYSGRYSKTYGEGLVRRDARKMEERGQNVTSFKQCDVSYTLEQSSNEQQSNRTSCVCLYHLVITLNDVNSK